MNSTSRSHFVPENTPNERTDARREERDLAGSNSRTTPNTEAMPAGPGASAQGSEGRTCPGNAPRRLRDYLMYPRVFLTTIICVFVFALQIAFGIYVWLFAK